MQEALWFDDLECEAFIKSGEARIAAYEKDRIIALQGDVCTTLDIVRSGSLAMQSLDEEGRLFTAHVLSVGESCGATLLFGSAHTYVMQVVAHTPCTILRLKKSLVLRLCEERREILLALLRIISDRAHHLSTVVNRISTLSLRESLLSYLHHLSREQRSTSVVLPTTKKDLAERLGFARTSVSRGLAVLREEGVLSYEGRRVTLHTSPSI
ncbi:MAG TPA: Crp/Fnr family transcriptional regulator [Sphaerochaeta sp.]|nr:Crp/Fnr family transcriptional regulator [Sphaerochaeta sp.]